MDVGALKQKISEDKEKTTNSYRRYPVRFLFMEMDNNTQDEIEDLVKSFDGELLELSDYIMKKDDGWMTKSRFVQIIKSYASPTKDTFVVGFSELIRFFSKKEIESTVLSLFDIENNNIMDPKSAQRRIYFICFSMVDNVQRVLQNSFARKELINPFINSDYEMSGEYREICFVSNDYAANIQKNKITTSVEWIGLWRHAKIIDFSTPIWCCSESLYQWHRKASPDNAFQIDVVNNTKDYMQKAYSLDVDFPYDPSEATNWDKLRDEYIKHTPGKSMADFISYSLGVDAKSTCALAGKMLTTDSAYEKWLIKGYVGSYLNNTFFAKVLKILKSNSKKELLTTIWQQGYWINDAGLLQERIAVIKELNKYAGSLPPEKEIQEVIYDGVKKELGLDISFDDKNGFRLMEISSSTGMELDDLRARLLSYYLKIFKPAFTGLSNTEKEFVINLYANGILDKTEIRTVYPALYMYLFSQVENRILEKDEWKFYLQAYRESKVADTDNPYLQRYYGDGCANATNLYSMYYAIQRQEIAISPYIDDSDVYILDGVGAEYLPLIVELLKKNGYDTELCDYAACHLPSITDVNKDYLSAVPYREWFLDFDQKVIHGDFYRTAANLRKAFDILQEEIKDITVESAGKRIVITADHGATARARWTDSKKKYNFDGSDHEGRCCKVASKSDYEDTVDYIVYEDEIKPGTPYVIALNDQSLYNRPKYEDHGGATIEEVLVPVIVAVPHGEVSSIAYKILDEKLEVSGLDKMVSFVIIPDPDEESYVIETDGTKHVLKKSGSTYSAKLQSGKEQNIIVVVAEKEYAFRTKSRAKKNMEGDDGFDD